MNASDPDLYSEFLDEEYAHSYMEEALNAHIATQIKVLREQNGWTQAQLADKTDMKQTRISVLENVDYSSWSINTLRRLARAFDLRLKVSFETFSSGIEEIGLFGRRALERTSRMADLLKKQKALATFPKVANITRSWLMSDPVTIWLPIRTVSLANQRERWAKRHKRAAAERQAAFFLTPKGVQAPCTVKLVRQAPRSLDDDNLRGAFKAIRDGIADRLGVKDNDPRIKWCYAQERGKPKEYAVRVEIGIG